MDKDPIKELEKIRARKGLSIEQFAARELEVSYSAYWSWLAWTKGGQAGHAPSRMAIYKIRAYLSTTDS